MRVYLDSFITNDQRLARAAAGQIDVVALDSVA